MSDTQANTGATSRNSRRAREGSAVTVEGFSRFTRKVSRLGSGFRSGRLASATARNVTFQTRRCTSLDHLIKLTLPPVVRLECTRSGDTVLPCFRGLCCSIIWSEIVPITRRASETGSAACGGGLEVHIGQLGLDLSLERVVTGKAGGEESRHGVRLGHVVEHRNEETDLDRSGILEKRVQSGSTLSLRENAEPCV